MTDPLSKAIENTEYWQDRCFKAEADNKRLREALERIAEETGGMTSPSFIEDIARKALEDE